MNKKHSQNGIAVIGVVVLVIIVAIVAGSGYLVFGKKSSDNSNESVSTAESTETKEAKIKHIGVNLDYYDPATNKAGDFTFTKEKFEFSRLFFEYGFTVPANSAGPEKRNPQPTFILPLGTKVHALVDGEVYDVPKLYSDDFSIQVKAEGSDLLFETEHVINVTVKKGDKVKAGDVIAEVSDYDARNYAGFGLVEIGVLKGSSSGPPQHLCTFDFLDESIKEDTLKKITAFQKSWEEYIGDPTIYDEANAYMPGCVFSEPIEG